MESPPLEGFNRCVDVALGDTGRGGLMLGLHDLRGLFPPKQSSGVGFPMTYGMHSMGNVFNLFIIDL